MNRNKIPILYIVVPCFNEEKVLPGTSREFFQVLSELVNKGKISDQSRILFVDDGSSDSTWNLLQKFAEEERFVRGISLSRNCGHQNAVTAGMMEAKQYCDTVISIDCDGQDDIHVIEDMIDAYYEGNDIVYGVRSNRETDSFFKKITAESYYKLLRLMGVEVVENHADYRLVSLRVLDAFSDFHEVNLFLRGLFPLIGFKSTCVYYARKSREAGESHYPLHKMLALAVDGITSMTDKPLQLIAGFGMVVAFVSLIGILWSVVEFFAGHTVSGWSSLICVICFFSGVQLSSIGIIGIYLGKVYMETKHRPRYFISERTYEKEMS